VFRDDKKYTFRDYSSWDMDGNPRAAEVRLTWHLRTARRRDEVYSPPGRTRCRDVVITRACRNDNNDGKIREGNRTRKAAACVL